jgi:streptogramin lyase
MSHRILFALTFGWLLFLAQLAAAEQAGTITTIAGTGKPGNDGAAGVGVATNIDQPFGVEIGPDGALYITEVGQHRVRRLDLKSGQLTTVAGCGEKGYSGDGGPATEAKLNEPYEVRFDRQGNMFFVEMQNHLIRRVDAKTGKISTVAGTGTASDGGDGGPASKAQFRNPHSIAFDAQDRLYVADIGNHRIRRIDPQTGLIESIAGNGKKELPRDGASAQGQPILGPRALSIAGNTMWIALREGNSVWRLDLNSGLLRHVAGTGKTGYAGDGNENEGGEALTATFNGPKGIAVGPNGRVVVVDTENQVIREINPETGTIRTIAGSGPKAKGYGGDGGPATSAKMDRPHGICVGPDGAVYIGDTNNHRVRVVRKSE